MHPSQSAETFWLLLSLLCLPLERQVEIIGLAEYESSNSDLDLVYSPASQLLSAMYQYFNGWWDEFEPNVKNAEKIFSMLSSGLDFGFTTNDYMYGGNWGVLRTLARKTLDEAEMELWPVPEKINFSDYIEIVDDFPAWRDSIKDED